MYYPVTKKYVCGIDLHAKTLTACVMDRDGKIMKKKTLDCQPSLVMDFLRLWGKDITVGVESTYNWCGLKLLKNHRPRYEYSSAIDTT